MDLVLMILVVVELFLLVTASVLNRVRGTKDLDKLMQKLAQQDSTVQSFSLGWNAEKSAYENVTVDRLGKAVVRYDPQPLGPQGKPVTQGVHGSVMNLRNGCQISGINVKLTCPSGYEGPNCTLKPICDPSVDLEGTLKPLTYTQFNALRLYANSFESTEVPLSSRKRRQAERTHPRLRVVCGVNGEYELQRCPEGTLLDDSLRCRRYDICQDRLENFKHNFGIDDDNAPLAPNEYYICRDNRSVKMTCEGNTIYSQPKSGCVVRSVCYGRNSDTIKIDEFHYVQCEDDLGEKIRCQFGLIDRPGEPIRCSNNTCKPKKFTHVNDLLRYDYGEITCDENGRSKRVMCDDHSTKKVIELTEGDRFEGVTYTIDHWPFEILKNGRCQTATDADAASLYVERPIVPLAWTGAMYEEHPFNLRTKQYECPDNLTQIDYNKVGAMDYYVVDPSTPCSRLYRLLDVSWRFIVSPSTLRLPHSRHAIYFGVLVLGYEHDPDILWPVYDRAADVYRMQQFYVDDDRRKVVRRTYVSRMPPFGAVFRPKNLRPSASRITPKGYELVTMKGLRALSYDRARGRTWYSIHTGRMAPFFMNDAIEETTWDCPKSISCDRDGVYGLLWDWDRQKRYDVLPNNELYFEKGKVRGSNIRKWSFMEFSPLVVRVNRETNMATVTIDRVETTVPTTTVLHLPEKPAAE